MSALLVVPKGAARDSPPEGWQESPEPFIDYRVNVDECQRISLGELERGPVSILFDHHTNAIVPENCRDEAAPYVTVLTSVWSSDPEVARLFADVGLPVRNATFEWNVNESSIANSVSFAAHGQGTSQIKFDFAAGAQAETHASERYVWTNQAGGISSLMLLRHHVYHHQTTRIVYGELSEPLGYSGTGFADFAGRGGSNYDGYRLGRVTHYADTQCQVPLT